jgi:hypothetical protein
MQKSIYGLALAASMALVQACTKDTVEMPDFNMTTAKTTYKVGDSVQFNFTGNPEIIVFFSGESGKKQQNANRTEAEGVPRLSFETSAQNGTQVNSLAVMLSTNFGGTYNAEGIAAASWMDISNRATLSTGVANIKSGNIDLSDFRNAERVHLAFKFTGQQDAASAQRQWTIKNFVLNNTLTDGTMVPLFANISAPNWLAVDVKNSNVKWATPTATQLLINGGPANTPDNEDWIITAGVNLKAIAPDLGTPLKNMTTRMNSYTYIYRTPGTYTASFVGANHTIKGRQEVVRDVTLTIVP